MHKKLIGLSSNHLTLNITFVLSVGKYQNYYSYRLRKRIQNIDLFPQFAPETRSRRNIK